MNLYVKEKQYKSRAGNHTAFYNSTSLYLQKQHKLAYLSNAHAY